MRFHNITIYLPAERLEETARLYREVLGLGSAFARPGHIACFELGGYDVALCLHEEEEGHPAGTVELGFWTAEAEAMADAATALGLAVSRVLYADGHEDPLLTDAAGTQVRLGSPPPAVTTEGPR